MDLDPDVAALGLRLGEAAARNGASMVTDKVRALRATGKHEDTIAGLEEIISGLISDKAEVTRIAQAYQSELISQRLTNGDVTYIADTLFPLLEKVASATGGAQAAAQLDAMRPLLSVETANVLQLLGFDFRRALGEPLTKLTEKAILSRVDQSEALRLESLKRDQLYIQLALDADALERYRSLFGPA